MHLIFGQKFLEKKNRKKTPKNFWCLVNPIAINDKFYFCKYHKCLIISKNFLNVFEFGI